MHCFRTATNTSFIALTSALAAAVLATIQGAEVNLGETLEDGTALRERENRYSLRASITSK